MQPACRTIHWKPGHHLPCNAVALRASWSRAFGILPLAELIGLRLRARCAAGTDA